MLSQYLNSVLDRVIDGKNDISSNTPLGDLRIIGKYKSPQSKQLCVNADIDLSEETLQSYALEEWKVGVIQKINVSIGPTIGPTVRMKSKNSISC